MAENNPQSSPASSEPISLAQAVLAPLDAIFKAQIHAARSYVNMLWQMAYQHVEVDDQDKTRQDISDDQKKPWMFPLNFETQVGDEKRITTVNIPQIAMVPVTPLGIDEATIKFSMSITNIAKHEQLQPAAVKKPDQPETPAAKGTDQPEPASKDAAQPESEAKKPDQSQSSWGKSPWYLVSDPVSLEGNIVTGDSSSSSVEINITIRKAPIPSALEKALTILTQNISITNLNR